MEFHVSRQARDRYGFDERLFSLSGNVILPDFRATRRFAQKINAGRDVTRSPELAVEAGELNAMGLIDEILHYVVALYRQQRDPQAMDGVLTELEERLGHDRVEATLRQFADLFPAVAVYRGEVDLDDHLAGQTDGVPTRQVVLEELLLIWLANGNPAFMPFRELFDDRPLAASSAYTDLLGELRSAFERRPPFGPHAQDLITLLRSPAVAVPDSLSGQLRWIRDNWGFLLAGFLDRLTLSLDVLQEDERARFLRFAGAGPAGEVSVYEFAALEGEVERFSPDSDWMPRLVLIAKSSYVWLDQLSKRYGREIRHLDQIPDEELDRLARWGISGLWLIGVWERSRASQRIKQYRGNPDAVASAYSLLDYRIADDLGGEEAYRDLRERARQRGIKLASDMVPNHMGIDSRWVIEHPDWFLGLDEPPYPSYAYTGPDLSDDPRVGVFIEDHYYDATDAAVVFKRLDRDTGSTRYIYHGNDGTSMPWNDTAQLDYLRPEVREGVIQTILHVARQFPVIRFDAAMTLAKRHIQRLWFPEPGEGGAIPSRAEHAVSKADFDRAMPIEFWREVVDRVAAEAPDTLLLAEAFWLMEGYFVRTLGMHRVYNSAFMNMLRDEKNAEYRLVMKNTLEFDPEILKRYVNFMNNPDERTAVDQFGKGDKYIGVCTLLATLPGLPMLGHGQVEGFAERYGMEYRRAYWDEQPDEELIERHERAIFPLLHRRHLFAEVRDFLLYDVVAPEGWVNEDVFAYSNRDGGQRSLVVYHNRFATARGWIRDSAAYASKDPDGEKTLVRRTLADGLAVPDGTDTYMAFRDHVTGLEFLRHTAELRERGLYVELDAYARRVFLDWRELRETPGGELGRLAGELAGTGVPSVDRAVEELRLRPLHDAMRRLVNPGAFGWIYGTLLSLGAAAGTAREARPGTPEAKSPPSEPGAPGSASAPTPEPPAGGSVAGEPSARIPRVDVEAFLVDLERQSREMFAAVAEIAGATSDTAALGTEMRLRIESLASFLRTPSRPSAVSSVADPTEHAARFVRAALAPDPTSWGPLLAWVFADLFGRLARGSGGSPAWAWLEEQQATRLLAEALQGVSLDEGGAWYAVDGVRAMLKLEPPAVAAVPAVPSPGPAPAAAGAEGGGAPSTAVDLAGPAEPLLARLVQTWFQDDALARYFQVHRHQGIAWFNKEAYERVARWWALRAAILSHADPSRADAPGMRATAEAVSVAEDLIRLGAESGYQVGRLLEIVRA